ncbi:MAG: DUF488 domain-containing protein [Gemmatimonadetes bacterium]|nr:DUF488 domain-containing protein [Gemmatimonadota bacterium]
MSSASVEIRTVGHSVLGFDSFVSLVKDAGVSGLADVRRFPVSRRHPHFNRAVLEELLPAAGLEYRWFEDLGGRRSAPRQSPGLNGGLRVGGFRAYADYALTPPFRDALQALIEWARSTPVAVCCAEALWWQCHRRIIADHLVTAGHRVLHLVGQGAPAAHELWDLARATPAGPVYPPAQPELFDAG